jgi:hypothetical protein
MKEGPSESVFKEQVSNHFKLLSLRVKVVSVEVKALSLNLSR